MRSRVLASCTGILTLLGLVVGLPGALRAAPLGGGRDAPEASGAGVAPRARWHRQLPHHRTKAPSRRHRPHVLRAESHGPRLHVVARVDTGVQPKSVVLSPDGRRVYVANFGMLDHQNVSVFDARTLAPLGQVDFPGNAVEFAFSHDAATLYVSNFRRHVVEIVDVASLELRGEVRVGTNPKTLALSPDGARLYCVNWSDGTLSIVDLNALSEVRRVRAGRHPRGLEVLPDGRVLVASFYDDVVRLLSPNGDRLRRFDTCHYPRHLALSPDASRLWITCTLGSIGAYDIGDGYRRVFALTGQNPRTLGVSEDGRYVATANFGSSDVSLLDTRSMRRRTSEVPGADKLVGLAFGPGASPRLYATSWDTSELIVLELLDR